MLSVKSGYKLCVNKMVFYWYINAQKSVLRISLQLKINSYCLSHLVRLETSN